MKFLGGIRGLLLWLKKALQRGPVFKLTGLIFLVLALVMINSPLGWWRLPKLADAHPFITPYVNVDTVNDVGEFTAIKALDSNTIYVAHQDNTNGNLRYGKSTNGGSTWTIGNVDTSANDVGEWVSLAVVDANTAYIGYWDATDFRLKFAKTTNGGTAWTTSIVEDVNNGAVGGNLSLAAVDANRLYISYYDSVNSDLKLAKSVDAGVTWTIFRVDTTGIVGRFTSIAAPDANTVYISYQDGPTNNLKFAKSTNGGLTWTFNLIDAAISADITRISVPESRIIFIAFNATADGTLKFTKSTDGGATFSAPSTVFNSPDDFDLYAIDRNNISIVNYNGTSDLELAQSTNGGTTWDANTIDSAGDTGAWPSVFMPTNGLVYISYHNSSNGDLRFAKTTHSTMSVTNSFIHSGASNLGQESNVYAVDSNTIYASYTGLDNDLRFAKSTNGGTSWTTSQVEASLAGNDLESSIYATGNTIYISYFSQAVNQLKIAKSTDGGSTWATQAIDKGADITHGQWSSIHGFDANTIWAAYYDDTDDDLTLARTINGGTSWTVTTIDSVGDVGQRTSVFAASASVVFITYYDVANGRVKLARSTDGGANWATINVEDVGSSTVVRTSVSASDTSNVYVSYYDATNARLRVAKSTDGGATVALSTVDSTTSDLGRNSSIHALDTNNVYISYYDTLNLDLRLARTTDAGTTWTHTVLDSTGDVGEFSSLHVINASNIFVTHFDNTNTDFKFSKVSITALNATPAVGFTDDNVIPVAQLSQATDGTGVVTITFKVRDPEALSQPNLSAFGASIDGGVNWIDLADNSAALGGNWPDRGGLGFNSATTLAAATSYTFTVNTKHADLVALNSYDSSTVRFRFKTTDGISYSPYGVSPNYSLDNRGPVTQLAFTASTIDSTGDVGRFGSTHAVDSSTVFISYVDTTNQDLKFAKTANGGSTWTTSTVETTGTYTDTSIFATDSNNVFIVAPNVGTGNILLAKSTNGGTSWTTSTFATNAGAIVEFHGRDASNLYVSYYNTVNTDLHYAKTTNGGTTWTTGAVDASADNRGGNNSIFAVDANIYFISYVDATNSNLRFARTTDGGTNWTLSTVEAGNVGTWDTSIRAVDANNIYISYASTTNNLRFAKSTNGGLTWTTANVDTCGCLGDTVTRLSGNQTIYIAYGDQTNGDLKLAKSFNSGTSFATQVVHAPAGVAAGRGPGISLINDGLIFFNHRDTTDGDLEFVYSKGDIDVAVRGTAADTTITTTAPTFVFETNPSANNFAVERNNAGYGGSTAGQAGTLTPAAVAAAVGATLDGDDLVTKVRVVHTDTRGNTGTNENTSPSLSAVTSAVPQAPTATSTGVTTVNVKIIASASEAGAPQYSIRFVAAGTQYVQADGTLAAGQVFQAYGSWGGAAGQGITGLTDGTTYTISTNARNPNGDNPASAFGATASYTAGTGGGGGTPQQASITLPTAPTTGKGEVVSTSQIRWTFTDKANNESGFNIKDAGGTTVVNSSATNISYLDEGNLVTNTKYSGRKPCVYNQAGTACSTAEYSPVYTLIEAPTSLEFKNLTIDSVTVNVLGTFTNLAESSSGLYFENLTDAVNSNPVSNSGWIKATSYNFKNLDSGKEYSFRVKARNGDGVETAYVLSKIKTLPAKAAQMTLKMTVAINTGAVLGSTYSVESVSDIFDSIYQASINLNFVLAIFALSLIVSLQYALHNLGSDKAKKLRAISTILFSHPSKSFEEFGQKDRRGVFKSEYAKHRHYHKHASASFLGLLSLIIVKGALITIIAADSETSLAQQVTVTDVKKGDEITYRLDYKNEGEARATQVAITAPIPALTKYISGSISHNGQAQTDLKDQDAGYYEGARIINFSVPEVKGGRSGYVLYRVLIDENPTADTVIRNAAQLTYKENATAISSNETSTSVKAPPPEPKPEPEPVPVVEPPVVEPPPTRPPPPAPQPQPRPSPAPQPAAPQPEPPASPTPGAVGGGVAPIIEPTPVSGGTPVDGSAPTSGGVGGATTQVNINQNQFTVIYAPPPAEPTAVVAPPPVQVFGRYTVLVNGVIFEGQTTVPNTTLRLEISGQQLTLTSDSQGRWSTMINREVLGTAPQTTATLQVINEDSSSEIVAVAVINLNEAAPPPPPVTLIEQVTGISAAIPEQVQVAVLNSFKIIKEAAKATQEAAKVTKEVAIAVEPQTQVTLLAVAPMVTVVNPTIALNLPNLPFLIYHFLNWLASVIGLKKRRQPWGVTYDAITKEPLSLTIVRLLKAVEVAAVPNPLVGPGAAAAQEVIVEGKKFALVETQVTDGEGRFGFLPKAGRYRIEVTKPGYQYPSRIVTTEADVEYEQVYRSGEFEIKENETISTSIPLDPVNPAEEKNRAASKNLISQALYHLRKLTQKSSLGLIMVGLVVSIITLVSSFNFTNLIFTILYFMFTIFQFVFRPKKIHPWGVVYDFQTLKPVPLAVVNILDVQYNKLLKTRLTDYEGRFSFLPPVGKYKLLIQKAGYKFPASLESKTTKYQNNYYGGEFLVTKEKEVVNIDVPLEPAA